VWLVAAVLAGSAGGQQAQPDSSDVKGRALLRQMVEALGGSAWEGRRNVLAVGRLSAFYQGKPTGDVTDFQSLSVPLQSERIEYGKHHDVVSIFQGREAWEVTYKGKHAIPAEQAAEYFRRRDHSVEEVVEVWLKDPATIVVSEGQTEAERHLADQVTVISSTNDSVTLQLDTGTHLPLRRLFEWRDPVYKDKNHEIEEYDDYHTIAGVATPFTVTRIHNGDIVGQRYLYRVEYNVPMAAEAYDADATAAKLKH
jgi:hypothetical protein